MNDHSIIPEHRRLPFDAEAAKRGEAVCTAGGDPVPLIYDENATYFPWIRADRDEHSIWCWTEAGKLRKDGKMSEYDLRMVAPEELEGVKEMTTITAEMIDSLDICNPAKTTLKSWFVGEELSEERIRQKLFAHMHVNSEGKTAINIGATHFTASDSSELITRLCTKASFPSLSSLVKNFKEMSKPKRNYSLDGANGTMKVELVEFGEYIVLKIGNYNILRLSDSDRVLEQYNNIQSKIMKVDSVGKAIIL